MSHAALLGYLVLSFLPLAAIAVVCGVGAVVVVERYGVRLLWTLWLLVAIAVLYLYYWQTHRIVTGRLAFMNVKDGGVVLPPVATAITTHLLHRFGVRRTISFLLASAAFGIAVYSISYYPTF